MRVWAFLLCPLFQKVARHEVLCTHKEIRVEEEEEEAGERMEIMRSCNNAYVEHITS